MESLTEAQIGELDSFAAGLSRPGKPVSVDYVPPSPFITVHYMRPGQSGAHRDLPLSMSATVEHLKGRIKTEVGV